MSSAAELTMVGISSQSTLHRDVKAHYNFTTSTMNQDSVVPYIASIEGTDSQELEDMVVRHIMICPSSKVILPIKFNLKDELDGDDDSEEIYSLESEDKSCDEICDFSTDSDIQELKKDWFALPIDCNAFPDIVFPKAHLLDTRVINAFHWTKDSGVFTDFMKIKHIDSPWNHLAHYVDWESYGFDLKLIGKITLSMGCHNESFSVFWKPSHTWYDVIFGANVRTAPQEVVVIRHNLALPSLYEWMEGFHKRELNAWMTQNRARFWCTE
ncbi:hypothetical protein M422DRAFT_249506 [Sphaerobolus stellatus SS14]|uniref:Uncharacterized protein n=1 Tax=Sphaerobolus stellatus (strain SS14) TaxID=990650 RepID=A0A0C9UUM6_SPHS4|nr:hypothetical protein M422DRAFT_249506 [Sphaerobolus stellatus SS14]